MSRPAGSSIAPIFLRLALGVTFVWAGLGKLEGEMRISGEPAAILANMGLHEVRKMAQPPIPATPATSASPAVPVTAPEPQPVTPPANDQGPVPSPTDTDPSPSTVSPDGGATIEPPAVTTPGEAPSPGTAPQPVLPSDITPVPAESRPPSMTSPPPVSLAQPNVKVSHVYTAAEFPKDVELKRVYGLSLILHRAANPSPRADGSVPSRLWPQRFSRGTWPLFFAWSVAIIEVAGGFFALAGLLTRASGLCLAAVMLSAMWLTELGPATQNNTTVLGFIPDRDWLQVDQWKTLFWQFSLMMSGVALAFLGSGALGFDRKLFPPAPPPPSHVKPLI